MKKVVHFNQKLQWIVCISTFCTYPHTTYRGNFSNELFHINSSIYLSIHFTISPFHLSIIHSSLNHPSIHASIYPGRRWHVQKWDISAQSCMIWCSGWCLSGLPLCSCLPFFACNMMAQRACTNPIHLATDTGSLNGLTKQCAPTTPT